MAKFDYLQNVEEAAKQNKDSFFIPSVEDRFNQEPGDMVRLHFFVKDADINDPRAERMWVEVTERTSNPIKYRGFLTNQPFCIEDLNPGDEIEFEPKHIARIIIKKSDPRWIGINEDMAFVSAMCFESGEYVRFLYREKVDREGDSGWRMFTGHETQEYTDDPQNTRLIEVGWMLDRDSSLLEVLKGDFGSVFERQTLNSNWVKVTDWSPLE